MEFLKKFGIGILYAIFFPFLLLGIALVAVYGILTFVVEFVIMLINFFSGKKCFPVFEEDIEANKRKEEALSLQTQASTESNTENKTNNIYVQQVYYNTDPAKMGMNNPFPQSQIPNSPSPFDNQIPQSGQPYQSQSAPFVSPNPFANSQVSQPTPVQIPPTQTPPDDIQELLSRAEKKGDDDE